MLLVVVVVVVALLISLYIYTSHVIIILCISPHITFLQPEFVSCHVHAATSSSWLKKGNDDDDDDEYPLSILFYILSI